ncbi:aldehyde dehydrogenase family protein [Pseudonocardia alni]|uniref:aldehyde dehydrogenase family protein n=1 Tax=Pseudonocardia alni TaxID=33907 RepID=UPI00280B58ED|nr:aldehyde dehydrogenase family protein [Pseudonocardia alni]
MSPSIPAYLQDHSGTADEEFTQLIDGEFVAGATTQDVVDPATGRAFAQAPVADAAQVDRAVAAAAAAFPGWSARSYDERGALVDRIADVVEANAELIARTVTREQGKPLADSTGDLEAAVAFCRYFAKWRPADEVVQDDDQAFVEIVRRPLGVVAAIIPWNFPFFQSLYKLAPALVTGNTIVIKPSPTTPLNGMLLGRLVADIVPAGVVNVVGDSGAVGPQLTAHPDVAKVSFTGSTASGRRVMESAASTLKRITLELGGNDPAIVLPDADVRAAAEGISTWAFANAGQVCISIKRTFVHSSIYDEFCTEMARIADGLTVGPGLTDGTRIGPIQNARQYESLRHTLDVAREGGTVLTGGLVAEGEGYFVRPTVVRDIPEDNPVVAEETFGPIRSVFAYDDIDDVVERANATPYGLGASVWGTDVEQATAVARRLDAGSTWVNQHFALSPDVPFGGRKQSGIGSEFGNDGILAFTDVQVVNVKRS